MMMQDLQDGQAFRFKDQWYSQFIFVKLSEEEILNWDLDLKSKNHKNKMEVEVVSTSDFTKADPERIKRYLNKINGT